MRESGGQVSLPVTCQAASVMEPYLSVVQLSLPIPRAKLYVLYSQTDSVLHVRHDMINDHVRVTTVERPDPKGLSTFVSAQSSCHTGGELMSSRSVVRHSS